MSGTTTAIGPIATMTTPTFTHIVMLEATFIGCSEDIKIGDIVTIAGIGAMKEIGRITIIAGIETITEIGGTTRTLFSEYF
jgi:hypothetical protein